MKCCCFTRVFHTLAGSGKSFFCNKCVGYGRMDSKAANEHRADMTPTQNTDLFVQPGIHNFDFLCFCSAKPKEMCSKTANEHPVSLTPTRHRVCGPSGNSVFSLTFFTCPNVVAKVVRSGSSLHGVRLQFLNPFPDFATQKTRKSQFWIPRWTTNQYSGHLLGPFGGRNTKMLKISILGAQPFGGRGTTMVKIRRPSGRSVS